MLQYIFQCFKLSVICTYQWVFVHFFILISFSINAFIIFILIVLIIYLFLKFVLKFYYYLLSWNWKCDKTLRPTLSLREDLITSLSSSWCLYFCLLSFSVALIDSCLNKNKCQLKQNKQIRWRLRAVFSMLRKSSGKQERLIMTDDRQDIMPDDKQVIRSYDK
jgi:hypothetical protein